MITKENDALFESLIQQVKPLVESTPNSVNKSALSIIDRAMKIAKDADDQFKVFTCLTLYGFSYFMPGNVLDKNMYDAKGAEYWDEAVNMIGETDEIPHFDELPPFFAEIIEQVGYLHLRYQDVFEGLEELTQAQKLYKKRGDIQKADWLKHAIDEIKSEVMIITSDDDEEDGEE